MQRRDERYPVARRNPRPRTAAELPVRVVDEHEDSWTDGRFRAGDEKHVGLGRVGGGRRGCGDAGDGRRRRGRVAFVVAIVVVVFAPLPLDRFDLQLLFLLAVEDRLKPAAMGADSDRNRRKGGRESE